MKDKDIFLSIPDVQGLTLRYVAGMGEQIEVIVRLKHGEVVLRLLADKNVRVTDLRKRDKRQTPRLNVPFMNGQED